MAKYDNLLLQNRLCFALYSASHAITRTYAVHLGKLGLTYPQHLVLLALWETDALAVNQVATRLKLDSATLTPILKRLALAGFITRQRSARDERVLEIKLTEKGRALRDECSRIQQDVACQTGLGAAEVADLRNTLHRLVETMAADASEDAVSA